MIDDLRLLRQAAYMTPDRVPEFDALVEHTPPLAHRARCGPYWWYQITVDGIEAIPVMSESADDAS